MTYRNAGRVPRVPHRGPRVAFRQIVQDRITPFVLGDRQLETPAQVIERASQLTDMHIPLPGAGDTHTRFRILAEIAAIDLSLARIVEGHADALAILAEARVPACRGLYGVWAADSGAITATATEHGYILNGRKRYCSGGTRLQRALVTTHEDSMFDVDLRAKGVTAVPGTWHAVGMAATDSVDVVFDAVPVGAPVGHRGFYLERPGFWHGAIGVAACWFGGALGAQRMLRAKLATGMTEHQAAQLGAVTASCAVMQRMLDHAAEAIDAVGRRPDPAGRERALVVRHVVERGCTEVLDRVGRAGGTTPLVYDRAHARRVADLTTYLRQHHAEADLAELGKLVLA